MSGDEANVKQKVRSASGISKKRKKKMAARGEKYENAEGGYRHAIGSKSDQEYGPRLSRRGQALCERP